MSACTGGSGGDVTVSGDQDQDPVLLEIPIAYVKRTIPETPIDYLEPDSFTPGARLLVRDRSSLTADEIDVTDQITSIVADELGVDAADLAIDIKDLDTSFDGKLLAFAARVVPEPVDANLEDTTWNLWLFDFTTQQARYLIPSRIKRNEGLEVGSSQDTSPHFLTDDRTVFTTTRQTAVQARQLNEGRAQIYSAVDEDRDNHASVLQIYDPEGGDDEFVQLSFNQSHDFEPVALRSGSIVFSRWNNSGNRNHVSLFKINPSGRQFSNYYGYHSSDTGTNGAALFFTQAREMEDGKIIAITRQRQADSFGGNIVIIDGENYTEIDQPTWANQGSLAGPGQMQLTDTTIITDGELSPGGQYTAVYPLSDGTDRLLVSWSPCRVINDDGDFVPCTIGPAGAEAAPPLYGAWIYDSTDDTQLPVVTAEEGFMVSEIVAAEPRDYPDIIVENNVNTLLSADQGQLIIDNVYDIDGAAGVNTGAPYLRLIQPVPIPDDDVLDLPRYAFGVSTAQSMREILGYVPIASDGSVSAAVPANTPIMISVLDANSRRVSQRHNFWIQVGSQEVVRCSGCHTATSELPHGRIDSQPASSNPSPAAASTIYDMTLDPDPTLAYDPAWDNIPAGKEIVVNNFDPSLPGRIVINYVDHIQTIWERTGRPLRSMVGATDIDSCVGCHTTQGDTVVPPGQLDLTSMPSDIDPDHLRSYRELLSTDNQQWLNAGGQLADRTRLCTSTDADGNVLTTSVTLTIGATMSSNGANSSPRFFGCFEGGSCGRHGDNNPPLPANCTEDGGTVVPPTNNTVDHTGLLSDSELRLISEWLDIGAQYYNNPFDSRLN